MAEYVYGGFSNETYDNLVFYLQNKAFPKFDENKNKKNAKDALRRKSKAFVVKDNRLFYVGKDGPSREVARKGDELRILKRVHDTDHMGINATYERVKSAHYWNNVFDDVKQFVKCCEKCQKSARFETQNAPLQPVPPPRLPFRMWGMDLTKLPRSDDGLVYLVVAVDYLTKYVEAAPLKTKEACGIVYFFDEMCSRWGFPMVVITDQGKEFCNKKFDDYCNNHGINHRTSTAYHPQVILSLSLSLSFSLAS